MGVLISNRADDAEPAIAKEGNGEIFAAALAEGRIGVSGWWAPVVHGKGLRLSYPRLAAAVAHLESRCMRA
jgi:hypothetical protein